MYATTGTMIGDGNIAQAVLTLDAWLDTMRGPAGYGGPVGHWWQNCLHFTGAGLDWRYEGIITGYLNLFTRTGTARWLAKARQAGNDLVRGQMATGNFRNSCFELNPYPGGTPHEAACDIGLLRLAQTLKTEQDSTWTDYLHAAARNINDFYLAQLWDSENRAFRDHPTIPSFVPNKSATLVEALILLAEITGDEELVEQYAVPTLDRILEHQLQSGDLAGAIYQYSQNNQPVAWFFPYYIARCVPGLVAGYEWTHDARYLESAKQAMNFVLRWRQEDGSFPQVVYPNLKVNRFPQWIAAVGDILHAAARLQPYSVDVDLTPTLHWMLQGQSPNGGFRTAYGFASQITQRVPPSIGDFRDVLPVCGWVDKTWRYLTGTIPVEDTLPEAHAKNLAYEQTCVFRRKPFRYQETDDAIRLFDEERLAYEWIKGTSWPSHCDPWFYMK